ncbi:MAG TPA: hypothetical protein VHW44_07145 [Pseudonocardiaceae bacterium]|nr:hypothetical protein [Pseudonocardiaceae bacterium]
MTLRRYRLADVVGLGCSQMVLGELSGNVDFFLGVASVVHATGDANHDTGLWEMEQGVLAEPKQTSWMQFRE